MVLVLLIVFASAFLCANVAPFHSNNGQFFCILDVCSLPMAGGTVDIVMIVQPVMNVMFFPMASSLTERGSFLWASVPGTPPERPPKS